jgi:hypothetical protein
MGKKPPNANELGFYTGEILPKTGVVIICNQMSPACDEAVFNPSQAKSVLLVS